MTARRRPARRRRRRAAVPITLTAVAALALIVLALAAVVAHGWPLLVPAAAGAAYVTGRRRATAPARAVVAERDRLAAELERLAAERDGLAADLTEARTSAALAWDAAAEVTPRRPRQRPDPARRAALLADPRSGAQPLVRGDQP
jgi:hypothetical protein